MTLAAGTDLVEIARVAALAERYGERFTRRVFTAGELADCAGRPECLAARWAAKEAAAKALGTGIGPVAFREIEVASETSGQPVLRLHGAAAQAAAARGLAEWALSLTHDCGLALAFVVGVGEPAPPAPPVKALHRRLRGGRPGADPSC